MANRLKWTYEKLKAEALKYRTRGEFYRKSQSAYSIAYKMHILDEICVHMIKGGLYWTLEMLTEEALKYKTRNEFHIKSPRAYSAACKKGVLDQVCAHMGPPLNRAHTHEELLLEAHKYKSRTEFRKNSSSMYDAAYRNDILDEICAHMKEPGNSSCWEEDLFCTIKSFLPDVKKLRDRKVKIDGKPYIKGFDIDIFDSDSNLGIEADGTYYHSFECMRKQEGKKHWNDEDIQNYHKIKDSWFASKDIQILHVKQEDWVKNKQACIDKCLHFLNLKILLIREAA
jgi:hypothetical protein